MATNSIFGKKNRADTATLSGGSWVLPLTEMQTAPLEDVARSTNLSHSSTQFVWAYDKSLYDRAFSLIDTNATEDCTVQFLYSDDPGFGSLIYDTGELNFYDAIYPSAELEFEDPNWFSGKPSEEDLEGYKRNFTLVLPSNVFYTYGKCLIKDDGNPDNNFEIGRFYAGPVWELSINPDYGLRLLFESRSLVDYTLGGQPDIEERDPFRVFTFQVSNMTEREGLVQALELQRRFGVSTDFLFSLAPDETENSFRKTIWGRLREATALEISAYNLTAMSFIIEERR